MRNSYVIPDGFWKSVCEDVNHPIACVDLENRFRWVNGAYEKLLGYSYGELVGKTWMEITDQADVGGDMASVNAVMDGSIDAYTLQKNYIHRNGRKVKVELTVRRFPESMLHEMICFRVEAPQVIATVNDVSEVRDTLMQHIFDLRSRVGANEHRLGVDTSDRQTIEVNVDRSIGGDHIGRDKNSDNTIKFIAGCLVAMAICMAWLMYYVASVANKAPMQSPPSITQEK